MGPEVRRGQCEPCGVAVRRTPEPGRGQDTQQPGLHPLGQPWAVCLKASLPLHFFFTYKLNKWLASHVA